jgi:hypothetical protein
MQTVMDYNPLGKGFLFMLSATIMCMREMLWRSNDPFNMDISIICQHARFMGLDFQALPHGVAVQNAKGSHLS